jgi:hypothetical protein
VLFRLDKKYLADPVRIGALIGALYGGLITLTVIAICLLLHFTDIVSSPAGGESHYGLLIGFVILPLAFLAAAPWSIPFFILSQCGHGLVAYAYVGIVLGLLISASIIGLLVGVKARARITRANQK